MKIKTSRKRNYFKLLKNIFRRLYKRASFLIILVIVIALSSPFILFEFAPMWGTYQKAKVVISNGPTVVKNYLSSINVSPEKFEISIKDKHLKKLTYIKDMSREYYIGDDNLDKVSLLRKEWFPAKIKFNGIDHDVEIRVKGQSIDHWGDYPSFKVKVKGDNTILGMKRFAIQHPKTRGFMNEWFFHQFLNFNGLIALRYSFVSLIINGDRWPIFAIEENFDKRLIENNKRKEGLIFQISYNSRNRIDLQQSKSKIEGTHFQDQANIVKKNIDSFFNGDLKTSDVFDFNQLAKYYAVIDLWGNHHAAQLKNIRFYYNPITSLIEPIGYDEQALYYTEYLDLIGSRKKFDQSLSSDSRFFDLVFNDIIFYKTYINELKKISNPNLLHNFFNKVDSEYNHQLKILYKSFPYFEYKSKYPSLTWFWQDRTHMIYPSSLWLPTDKSVLYENQTYISNSIKLNNQSINVYYKELLLEQNAILIKVKSREKLPVEVTNVTISGIPSRLIGNKIIQSQGSKLYDNYNEFKVEIPNKIDWVDSLKNTISIQFKIASESMEYKILNTPPSFKTNFIKEYSNLNDFTFINVNNDNKIISIQEGDHVLNTTLIIPPGYELKGSGNISIKLVNNAKIISYSPINFVGTEDNPIRVFSDSTSQGIAVINANFESYLHNVEFNKLSYVSENGWGLTGAVTFYESKVNISNCIFANSFSEDALNIVRSEFIINNTKFINSKSDALDIDFSDGQLTNIFFINNGNDGLDVSGAKVNVQNINIDVSGDKGISIGENSFVNLQNVSINNSNIAIACKDKSVAYIDAPNQKESTKSLSRGLTINNCNFGFAVYQKKSEFGPAEIHIGNRNGSHSNMTILNTKTHFLVEKNSFLEVGDQTVSSNTINALKTIYNN
jgi:hypothetical protein